MKGEEYHRDLNEAVKQLYGLCPSDLGERFGRESGLDASDFCYCGTEAKCRVAAVDGSNSMILEAGLYSIAAVRAVVSCFAGGRREFLSATPIRLVRLGMENEVEDFISIYERCFGSPPESGLPGDDRSDAVGVIRDTLEHSAALHALDRIGAGDLLLLDGGLRVSHASHRPVLNDLLVKAGANGALVAGVSKHSTVTWGDGLPLVLSVDRYARRCGIRPPYYVRIPEELMDRHRYGQWQRGVVYVAKLHPRTPRAFKIEVPDYADEKAVRDTFQACAAYADDGRIPGYPYPLLDAHRKVRITEDIRENIYNDLIAEMNRTGMNREDFVQLFGDYHDEFNRY